MAFFESDLSSYLVILITTVCLILIWKAVSLFLSQSNIPRPKGNILTGQLFELLKSKDVMQTFDQWVKMYGPIVEFRPLGILGPTSYLVADADAFKQILVSKSFKYHRPNDNTVFNTKNLVGANGKEHSRMRKMINPVFKVNNLKSMVEVFHDKAKLLTKFWNKAISAKLDTKECQLFVQNDLTRMSLDVLGECVFGYEFNSTEAGDSPVSRAFHDMFAGVNLATMNRKLVQWLPFLERFLKGPVRPHEEALKITEETIKGVIDNKIGKQTDSANDKTRKDLLDLLLEAVDDETGQGMDKDELHSQVFVFLFAGHDTTSVALSWTLYFLAQYPDVQDKLRREVQNTLKDQELEWKTYEAMEYLTAVVNESLRLRTPAPVFRREAVQDDNILGYKILTGSHIIISPYVINRSPEYWTDPEKFNPDRFLEQEKENNPSNRFAFLPFSTGPRTCIGYRFALMEIKIVVATLIQSFSFSMVPGMSFEGSISVTYKPKPALELLVRKLNE